jgi:hypothetical protein
VLSGSPPPLEAEAVAELRRLRDVEKQFKRLQMEHDLLKRAIRFASAGEEGALQHTRAGCFSCALLKASSRRGSGGVWQHVWITLF